MVNNKVLGCFALRLGFDALLLHADADKDGVRFKDDVDKYLKLLADAFEAFMGAVYLDADIGAVHHRFSSGFANTLHKGLRLLGA